ncbi:MAG: tetratricopeptide repeat protein [Planctomycetes bacterium]|jgi:tetratricopeptide (TPR) repeat protein|nr:tetratricopeptide repeat protein [Planctomycetota bacterium]
MPAAIVFACATSDGLAPIAGAAPWDVLARQLPRLLVARLNGCGDRGVRFFPFLGPVDGQRSFLRPHELFEPAVLGQVHRQGDVELLCDSMLESGRLRLRLIDGRKHTVRHELQLAFDPRAPLDVLPRLEFELAEALGWQGRPQPPVRLSGEPLGWFLVLKDELLRREAGLPQQSSDPLRAARRCLELQPGEPEIQDLVLDYFANLLRSGLHRADVARLLATMVPALAHDVTRLERLDALLLAAGDDGTAAAVACRAALLQPERSELVERAAAQAFRLGRYDDVRAVVECARQRGVASPAAIAQLAAACDRAGDHALRATLVQQLVGLDDLPIPVARLVVSFLLEESQPGVARAIVERALRREPDHAMLHFELGRACLLLEDESHAAAALHRALQIGLQPVLAGQARRFLRLSSVPGLWAAVQQVEQAIARGDLDAAFAAARAMVRRAARMAEAWFLLGVVLHKRGRLRRAERTLRRAVQLDTDSPDAHNRLGILLVSSGRLEEGHRHLERAHQLAPNDPSPLLHMAQACALLGRMEAAEACVAAAEKIGAEPQLVQAVRREILVRPA